MSLIKIPFSDDEIVVVNSDQYSAVATELGKTIASGSSSITITSNTEMRLLLAAILKVNGYSVTTKGGKRDGVAGDSFKTDVAGTYDILASDKIIRIVPFGKGEAVAYYNDHFNTGYGTGVNNPLKTLLESNGKAYTNSNYKYLTSREGVSIGWKIIDSNGGLSAKMALANTIINNLITQINTLRSQHSLSPVAINDDGTIS